MTSIYLARRIGLKYLLMYLDLYPDLYILLHLARQSTYRALTEYLQSTCRVLAAYSQRGRTLCNEMITQLTATSIRKGISGILSSNQMTRNKYRWTSGALLLFSMSVCSSKNLGLTCTLPERKMFVMYRKSSLYSVP